MPPKTDTKKSPAKKAKGGKKKLSNYMIFAKETRPTIKEELPDLTFGEVGKELGKRWRALTDDEKAAYKK
eukprot:CAMPEP_0172301090 /NCGR_PEP_ID=MMETSP1058-20130122/3041_1 /TAXON_ID=83371 /ORGANISM="Detonula confervacea, Strain CCMP 353" /LENGTH=69 /DNA_ID=CAMNT_0013011087 /DNA_START=56 /DNA_END=265 /DNA_ORIENTATION=+